MTKETIGIISMLVFEVMLGTGPLIYKFIDTSISSSVIVAIRFGSASVFLFLWFVGTGAWKKRTLFTSPKRILGILFLGVLGAGIAPWWYLISIRNIGAILSTLLTNLEIPLGVFLGYRLLGERVSRQYLSLFAIILVGYVCLVIKNGISVPMGGSYGLGIALSIGAAVIWGVCTIVGKRLTTHVSAAEISLWRLSLGALTVASIAWSSGQLGMDVLRNISIGDWLWLLWLGVVTSGIGLLCYYYALSVLPVKKISLFFPLSTVITVILSFAWGETPLWSQWLGIVLITGGMIYFFVKKASV